MTDQVEKATTTPGQTLGGLFALVPDGKQHYAMIGRIVVAHSTLEFALNSLLAKVFKLDVEEGLILTTHLPWRTRLDALKSWSKLPVVREAIGEKTAALVDQLEKVNRARNDVVHGLFIEEEDSLHILNIKARGQLTTTSKDLSNVTELQKVHDDLIRITWTV